MERISPKKKILEEFINEGNDPQETTYFLSDNDLSAWRMLKDI